MDTRLPSPGFDTLRAGLLALLVHLMFFGLLAFGVRWNQQEPEAVMAELWSELPVAPRAAPAPVPAPAHATRPEPRPEPKVEPKVEAAKPDIALKARPEPNKPQPKKAQPTPASEPKPAPKPAISEPDPLQQQLAMIERQQAMAEAARAAAANQSVIGEYKGRIKRKIRSLLNRQPCGDTNVQVEFDITLLPTGQLRSNPLLTRSSGIPACDRAVEYAIVQADPLPVPPQPELFQAFRNLHLIIRPNDPND
ncbi:cell envelope integrity protein TolA [Thiobacter aerophilum]|uniref:Cell envelope integrity protein TolA n=1 Tax=Thiobacter aerophilum TaxID=3121275 RepID=A0ABV0EJ47_9BURK